MNTEVRKNRVVQQGDLHAFTFSELQPQDCGQMSFFLSCAQPSTVSCLALRVCYSGSLTHTVNHVGDCSGDIVGGAQQEY